MNEFEIVFNIEWFQFIGTASMFLSALVMAIWTLLNLKGKNDEKV